MFRQNRNKFLELIFMDNTTRDHLIKLMKQKIESEMVDGLNGLEDYEKLGERITSALKEKFAKNTVQEEDNGALFDDDDEEFNEFEETNLASDEVEEEEEEEVETVHRESPTPPIVEDVVVDEEQPITPLDEIENTTETEEVDHKKQTVEVVNEKQEDPELKLADESKTLLSELKITPDETEKVKVLTDTNNQAVDKLQKQFEKEFEILQTIHKLERWEIAKRHRQLEEDFIEEFEKKLKEIQDSF